MTSNEQKEIFTKNPTAWVPYTDNNDIWRKAPATPSLIMWECNHVLIATKDADIAKALCDNKNTKVFVSTKASKPFLFIEEHHFFETYNDKLTYQL